MPPVYRFTVFTEDGPDVYIVDNANTPGEAMAAFWDERKYELAGHYADEIELTLLTTNSMIHVVESDQE
jgi:hypothetical protein